jgi:SsrA-binding protein
MYKKIDISNKKAFFDYEIIKKYESGIVLKGAEIKSIREGKINLKNSFCKFFKGELYSINMHISKYENSSLWDEIEETRNRKLLLKRKELNKLETNVNVEGYSIIPLRIYFNENNKCKLEIGLCKGKKIYDKKNSEKEKDIKKYEDKELKNNKY